MSKVDMIFVEVLNRDRNECWLMEKSLTVGYGKVYFNGKVELAHRVSYYYQHGALPPDGYDIDHLCRVRNCYNPSHLEAVTHRENCVRGDNFAKGSPRRDKTHCPQGHEYNQENTWYYKSGRACKICPKLRRKGLL